MLRGQTKAFGMCGSMKKKGVAHSVSSASSIRSCGFDAWSRHVQKWGKLACVLREQRFASRHSKTFTVFHRVTSEDTDLGASIDR